MAENDERRVDLRGHRRGRTGLALLIVPSFVGQLLLGEQLTGVAVPVSRLAGIALIALGIACWPGPPLVGMLSYSVLATLYLAYLGSYSDNDKSYPKQWHQHIHVWL